MACCCEKHSEACGGGAVVAATGAPAEELVLKLARFDADEISRKMDGVLEAAQAVAPGKRYAPETRLSGRVAGAGGTGEPHAPLSRLDAPAKCVLCDLTRGLSEEPGYNFLRYTKDETLLTEFECGECKLPMHRSCAWYWHQRKSPYSRHVMGIAETKPTRLWAISEDALPAFVREGRLVHTGDPGEQGAVRMARELTGPWAARERMYAVSGARFEHDIVKAGAAGECMLCKLTQRAWSMEEGAGGEKKTRSAVYRCTKCGVHLHLGCFNVWHEERVPYSRIVWRARERAGGALLTQAQAARLYAATNPASGAQNVEGRLSH
eukprot:183760-Rhodomonas_salina.2